MPILLNDNLDIKAPRPTDNRYGPYASTAAALAAIPPAQRYIGLTVGVLGVGSLVEEYWFNDGILDTDFVLKAFGSTSDTANAAYAQANAARDQANTARSDANTTFATINTTFGTINTNISTVYSQANAAYDAANNAKVTVYQNSATVATTQKINFINTSTITVVTQNDNGNANVGFIAVGGAAYDQANAAYNAANNAANTVRVSGNSGATLSSKQLNFVNTSTALVTISDSLNGNANISIDVIGGGAIGLAYDQANAAYAQANAARLQANTARSDANTTFATINTTFSTLNTNITTANTQANNAYDQANAARNQANTARNDANTTFATINTTFATINTNTGIVYAQANAAYNEANLKLNLTGGTISGNLTVQGNLFLTGNATYINVATLKVNDSIIQLSSNSIADAVDIGFSGHYSKDGGTTNLHAGIIRHASDNVFYIFDGYPYEPTNNVIDIASANLAWLRANVNAASLLLQGNVVATQANLTLAHNQANSALDQANTARDQANAARDQANTARSDANTTFATINTTFSTINTTFSTLNTNTGIVYAQANAARDQANAAYSQANAARDQANTARSDANTTFATINTTFSTLNTNIGAAYSQANTAYDQANTAYGQANTAYGQANLAYAQANTARDQSNTAYGQANLAYAQANSARDQANTAYDQANNARDQANTARDQANAAYGQANTAYGQANLAYSQANSAANTVRVSQNSTSTLSAKQLNFVNTGNIVISVTDSGDGNANVYLYASNVAGKTVIGVDSNTLTAQATVFQLSQNVQNINRLAVSKNGLRLVPGTHYTFADNTQVTLTTTAEINDEILFEYFYDIGDVVDWILAYDQANAAYTQANAARNQANAAYDAANNAKVTVFQNSASAVTTQNINFVNTSTITVSVDNSSGNANVGFIADSIVNGTTTLKVSESKLELFSNGFSTANDSISRTYLLRGTTTDGNEKEILLSNGSRIPVSTNTTVFYTADIVGRRTDATGESAGYYVKGVVDDYSGSVADIGTLYEVVVAEDDVDWSVDARADDTNNTINIYVTGETAKTIRWTAVVKTVEVAG